MEEKKSELKNQLATRIQDPSTNVSDLLFFFPTETFGCIFRKSKKERKRRQKIEGRKLSINQKAISVGVRLAAPRFLAGLIAFHYKFPPQPIRDRSVAVRPAGPPTHTL